MDDNEPIYMSLQIEDDEEIKCMILCTYDVEDKSYIALAPVDEEDEPQDEIFIYGYVEQEDGFELISPDDSELEIASAELDRILEEIID